jgi:hypothetical protein
MEFSGAMTATISIRDHSQIPGDKVIVINFPRKHIVTVVARDNDPKYPYAYVRVLHKGDVKVQVANCRVLEMNEMSVLDEALNQLEELPQIHYISYGDDTEPSGQYVPLEAVKKLFKAVIPHD